MVMKRTTRESGIRPGSVREAANVNAQIDNFQSTLGDTENPTLGALREDNFSKFAGILETKINFDPSAGHNHFSASGDGAEIADNSIGMAR
jgi:hypothetical protein